MRTVEEWWQKNVLSKLEMLAWELGWRENKSQKKHVIIALVDQCAISQHHRRELHLVQQNSQALIKKNTKWLVARLKTRKHGFCTRAADSFILVSLGEGGILEGYRERGPTSPGLGRLPDCSSSGRDCSILGRNVEKKARRDERIGAGEKKIEHMRGMTETRRYINH